MTLRPPQCTALKKALTTLLLFPLSTIGAQDIPSTPNLELTLKVKPSLCLRYAQGDTCKFSVEVTWRDSAPNNYCLHSIQDTKPLKCWSSATKGMLTDEREMSEDLVYWLSKPGESNKLVSATIVMATVVEDEKRTRKRRRHVWNLI